MRTLLCLIAFGAAAFPQAIPTTSFDAPKLTASVVTYQGKSATRLVDRNGGDGGGGLALLPALSKDAPFHNGTIEVDVAGQPSAGSFETARGFVGVAFRV